MFMKTMEVTLDIGPETLSNGERVYVASFREVDICTQGSTIEEAKKNAIESMTLFLDCASESELNRRVNIPRRTTKDVFTSRVEIPIGHAAYPLGA